MGVDAQRSLRLSVGWSTTQADVDAAISALEGVLADLRSMRVRR
jgi:cysteine sulfinate desulfinase/cysteine desulfurase-like protein